MCQLTIQTENKKRLGACKSVLQKYYTLRWMFCSCLIWNLFSNAKCFQTLLRIFDICLIKVYVRMIKNRLIRLLRCHRKNILRKRESFFIKQWRCIAVQCGCTQFLCEMTYRQKEFNPSKHTAAVFLRTMGVCKILLTIY